MTQALRRWRIPALMIAVIATAACTTTVSAPGSSIASAAASAGASQPAVLNDQQSVAAGRYRVDPTLPMKVTVAVPEGWAAGSGWVVIGPKGNGDPDGMAIRFYMAESLFQHPRSPGDGLLTPAVGPSVDDLATAIVNHPDWTVTGHSPITMDGNSGQVLHVTLPEGTSEASPFYFFGDATGGHEWGWNPAQLFDIYIVDVGGKRLVVDAFHYAGTSAGDLAAQSAVIASIKIEQS